MIPGPVFSFELLTTARRARFYVMRVTYTLALLAIFWTIHANWSATADSELTPKEMSWFAIVCFCSVAVAQIALVVVLTPALVAGVIADERQRRTLHYLMASRLSSSEIVLGKLFSRMLNVGVVLGAGFPVLNLLVLLGGIDPWLILVACGAAASTAWFLAALSVWASTIARRVREALFICYGLEFLWLFIPLMATWPPSVGVPWVDVVLDKLLDWLTLSSPVGAGRKFFIALVSRGGSVVDDLIAMIQIQLGAGAVFAALAAWQLRPMFRALEEAGTARRRLLGWLSGGGRSRRLFRPALGDRPMLWKELFTSRARGLARFVAVLVTLIGGGCFLYYAIWYGLMAAYEMWERGYLLRDSFWYASQDRARFLWFLQFTIPLLYLVGILSVAGAAAASIASEHDEDTWTSLTATDLTAREIVLAKLAGALWRPRGVVVVIFLSVLAGVLTGAVHPLSLPVLAFSLAVYGWFASAIGVLISLHLKSTWRAQFLTISGLWLVNLIGQAVLSNVRRYAPMLWPGFTPYEVGKAVLPPYAIENWIREARSWSLYVPDIDGGPVWTVIMTILSLSCYLVGAIVLSLVALARFDAAAGRARRSRRKPQ
jgi:ABC-type transport system involved in multi-copper enzyme maturation permease subunit